MKQPSPKTCSGFTWGCVWPRPPFWPRPQLLITPKIVVFKQLLMKTEFLILAEKFKNKL